MKIENLTAEQEKIMDAVADEYINNALGGNDEYDAKIIQAGIEMIYSIAGLDVKQIVVCSSPAQLVKLSGMKEGTIDYLGCGYDSDWTAFYDFFQRMGVEYEKTINFDVWRNFVLKSGVFGCKLFSNVAFVFIRPCEIHFNNDSPTRQLSRDGDYAIKWRDGTGYCFLNGVHVPESVVFTPAEKLEPGIILTEKNAEIRREIIKKIGIERVCQKLGAEIVDKSGDGMYELLTLTIGDGNKRPYLKMRNPSIGVYHIEGVPVGIKTVEEALQFRKPLEMKKIPVSENGQDWYQQGDVCIWPRAAKFLKPRPAILT